LFLKISLHSLSNGEAFDVVIDALCDGPPMLISSQAIEARGFIFGKRHGNGNWRRICALRKAGKLPHHVFAQSYELEYGVRN
jgi:adenine phosphoribosyltransferase